MWHPARSGMPPKTLNFLSDLLRMFSELECRMHRLARCSCPVKDNLTVLMDSEIPVVKSEINSARAKIIFPRRQDDVLPGKLTSCLGARACQTPEGRLLALMPSMSGPRSCC